MRARRRGSLGNRGRRDDGKRRARRVRPDNQWANQGKEGEGAHRVRLNRDWRTRRRDRVLCHERARLRRREEGNAEV